MGAGGIASWLWLSYIWWCLRFDEVLRSEVLRSEGRHRAYIQYAWECVHTTMLGLKGCSERYRMRICPDVACGVNTGTMVGCRDLLLAKDNWST